jgi:hypothetical protein
MLQRKYTIHAILNSILFFTLFNLAFTVCHGQETYTVSKPRLAITNDVLTITYDIIDSNPDDRFNIWLEISDSSGNEIKAKALNGDIGNNIKPGKNLQVKWNLQADNIYLDQTINVLIVAEKIEPKIVSEVKVGSVILKSAVFPGWGMTELSNGKPYWIMGVAATACLGSSIYLNRKAQANYEEYLTSTNDDIFPYWNDAVNQNDISQLLGWTAVAIWVVDMGLVTIKAVRMNKSYKKSQLNAFSISPGIDPYTNTASISLRYNFKF